MKEVFNIMGYYVIKCEIYSEVLVSFRSMVVIFSLNVNNIILFFVKNDRFNMKI